MTALVQGFRRLVGMESSTRHTDRKTAARKPVRDDSSTAKTARFAPSGHAAPLKVMIYQVSMPRTVEEFNGYVLSPPHFAQLMVKCKSHESVQKLLDAQGYINQLKKSEDAYIVNQLRTQIEECLASALDFEARATEDIPKPLGKSQSQLSKEETADLMIRSAEINRILQEQLALRNTIVPVSATSSASACAPEAEHIAEATIALPEEHAPAQSCSPSVSCRLRLPGNIQELIYYVERPVKFASLQAQFKSAMSKKFLLQAREFLVEYEAAIDTEKKENLESKIRVRLDSIILFENKA